MEISVRRVFARVLAVAEPDADQPAVEADELRVSLDLNPEQWRAVFAAWYGTDTWPAPVAVAAPEPLTLQGVPAWRYAGARADARGCSAYWRAYLVPHGRSAGVVRSVRWRPTDLTRYGPALDQAATDLHIF